MRIFATLPFGFVLFSTVSALFDVVSPSTGDTYTAGSHVAVVFSHVHNGDPNKRFCQLNIDFNGYRSTKRVVELHARGSAEVYHNEHLSFQVPADSPPGAYNVVFQKVNCIEESGQRRYRTATKTVVPIQVKKSSGAVRKYPAVQLLD